MDYFVFFFSIEFTDTPNFIFIQRVICADSLTFCDSEEKKRLIQKHMQDIEIKFNSLKHYRNWRKIAQKDYDIMRVRTEATEHVHSEFIHAENKGCQMKWKCNHSKMTAEKRERARASEQTKERKEEKKDFFPIWF